MGPTGAVDPLLLAVTLLRHTPRRLVESLDALSTNGLRRAARHRHCWAV